jgi:hypothetical protein
VSGRNIEFFPREREKGPGYSITSLARESSVAGTSRPSAFAVLRLITNSNLVGCMTGRSSGENLMNRLALVFVIETSRAPRFHRDRHPRFCDQLL